MRLSYYNVSQHVSSLVQQAVLQRAWPAFLASHKAGNKELSGEGALTMPVGLRFGAGSAEDHILHASVTLVGGESMGRSMSMSPPTFEQLAKAAADLAVGDRDTDLGKQKLEGLSREWLLIHEEKLAFNVKVIVTVWVESRTPSAEEAKRRKSVAEVALKELDETRAMALEQQNRGYAEKKARLEQENTEAVATIERKYNDAKTDLESDIATLEAVLAQSAEDKADKPDEAETPKP
jgi:hypothetical protein